MVVLVSLTLTTFHYVAMLLLRVPYPDETTVTILPNPQLGDSVRLLSEVSIKRAMDSTLYSYVKKTRDRKYVYNFDLTQEKARELGDLYKLHAGKEWLFEHESGLKVIGHVDNNPLSYTTKSGRLCCDESVDLVLEFTGYAIG